MREVHKPGQTFGFVLWEGLKAEEEGQPHFFNEGIGIFRTFHATGDFAGAALEIGGKIVDAADYLPLNDGECQSLIFDEPSIKHSPDLVLAVRPKVLGGTKETRISVGMTVRK